MYLRVDRVSFILTYYYNYIKEVRILLWMYMMLWWIGSQVTYIATGTPSLVW